MAKVFQRRHRQALIGAALDKAHPLYDGLVAYVVATPSGLVNLVTGNSRLSTQAGATITSTDFGSHSIGRRANTVSSASYEQVTLAPLPALTSANKLTVWSRSLQRTYVASGTGLQRTFAALVWGAAGACIAIEHGGGGSAGVRAIVTGISGNRQSGDVSPVVNEPFDAFAWHDGNTLHFELNGVAGSDPAGSNLSNAAAAGIFQFGVPGSTASPGDSSTFVGGAWLRQLSAAERQMLRVNPYVLVRNRSIRVPVAAAVGFDGALMAAMWRQHPDLVYSLPQVSASGMTPPEFMPN